MRGEEALLRSALAEEIGDGDVTARALLPPDATAVASIVQKDAGVLSGLGVAGKLLRMAGVESFSPLVSEGEWSEAVPRAVARIEGNAHALLAARRPAMSVLSHLSGIATLTARYVKEVDGLPVSVLATRKTTVGMRELEKAAVEAGGGLRNDMGLSDRIWIKSTHADLVGGLVRAVELALGNVPGATVDVECQSCEEGLRLLELPVRRLVLDNMPPDELREAVARIRERASALARDIEIEATGGIALETVREFAATGVEHLSIGAITHSAPALDVSLTVHSSAGVAAGADR